jgi:membrane fusion protein (multidrug efflux system)
MNAVSEKPSKNDAAAQSIAAPIAPDTHTERPRNRGRLLRGVAIVAVLLGAVALANWWFTEARWIESTDNAYVQGDIAVLGPRIDGDVIAVNVADNQIVKAGAPLISFDPQDRQAALDSARGIVAEATAAIEVARRQIGQQRSAIAQADSMISNAKAEQVRAASEASRSGSLVGAGWTSRQANETAIADERKADAMVANATAQRDVASQALSVAEAQLAQSQAHLVTATAQMRIAENNLSYTVLKAPFDGVVGNRAVQVGAHVLPGQQLISVTPLRTGLYVVANFKETQLTHMRPGQSVLLTGDIDTSTPVHGRVESLAPATGALFSLLPPENATGNFTKVVQRVPTKIVIDPKDAARATWLRAGLSVTAEVDTREGDHRHLGLIGTTLATLGLN